MGWVEAGAELYLVRSVYIIDGVSPVDAWMWYFWPQWLGADITRSGYVIGLGLVVGASCNLRSWAVRLLLGVSIGAGGDRAGFWSKQSVWVLDGDGKLTLFCGLIVTASGYGRRASGSVLGLGLVVGAVAI